jgi:hypothetical protein
MGVQRASSIAYAPMDDYEVWARPCAFNRYGVPSFDGIRIIWLSGPGGGPCEGLPPLGRALARPARAEATTTKATNDTANASDERVIPKTSGRAHGKNTANACQLVRLPVCRTA